METPLFLPLAAALSDVAIYSPGTIQVDLRSGDGRGWQGDATTWPEARSIFSHHLAFSPSPHFVVTLQEPVRIGGLSFLLIQHRGNGCIIAQNPENIVSRTLSRLSARG